MGNNEPQIALAGASNFGQDRAQTGGSGYPTFVSMDPCSFTVCGLDLSQRWVVYMWILVQTPEDSRCSIFQWGSA